MTRPRKSSTRLPVYGKPRPGPGGQRLSQCPAGLQGTPDDKGIANASDKLADVCLEKEDYARALPHLDRAMAICEPANDDFSITALRKKYAALTPAWGTQ